MIRLNKFGFKIMVGDAIQQLRQIDDYAVDCCITSPPYFGLRDYGVDGQIGLEETPQEYVAALIAVFREVRRVLRNNGTLWLNLGDSYAGAGAGGGGGNRKGNEHGQHDLMVGKGFRGVVPPGLKPKDLIGIPWMVAFALRADGWYLRSDIIWHKPNPMPESVTDRPTKSHEYLFLLSKQANYYCNMKVIAEPASLCGESSGLTRGVKRRASAMGVKASGNEKFGASLTIGKTRNCRSVWTVTPAQYRKAHFATFPPKLIEPCVLASSRQRSTVLDPFCGSGTTGEVAIQHGRSFIGIELKPEYAALSVDRVMDAVEGMDR